MEGRRLRGKRLAVYISVFTFVCFMPFATGSVGMVLFVLGLFFAGLKGAPRKTYGTGFTQDPMVIFYLSLMGVGTLLAVAGGVIFVLYALRVVLKGGQSQESS